MLVLTRKVGEKIVVPHCRLSVTVLEITPGRVRLGVSAPKGVAVHREEIQRRVADKASLSVEEILASAHVLVAAADRFLVASYGRYLSEQGARVSTATTALDCVAQLRIAVPDVLVLQPKLLWGGSDGVLALITEEPRLRPTAVMLLHQARERGLLYRLSSFRVDDYQTKPLTARGLAERICGLLSSARFVSPSAEPSVAETTR